MEKESTLLRTEPDNFSMKNQRYKILLIGFLICLFSYGLMLFIDHYLFVHLGEWTMSLTNKFLVAGWINIDRILISLFPLIIGVGSVFRGYHNINAYVLRVIWTLISIICSLLSGIILALFTWQNLEGDYMLLPTYIKYQPFVFYWTFFITIGILVPIFPLLLKRKVAPISNQTIDQHEK